MSESKIDRKLNRIKELVMNKYLLFLSLFLISMPSYAYLGPGMSGGAIAAIIGFFAGIILIWGRFFLIFLWLSEEPGPQFKLLNIPVDFPPNLLKKACSIFLNLDNFFDLISLKP